MGGLVGWLGGLYDLTPWGQNNHFSQTLAPPPASAESSLALASLHLPHQMVSLAISLLAGGKDAGSKPCHVVGLGQYDACGILFRGEL